jgi:hypothetical protein
MPESPTAFITDLQCELRGRLPAPLACEIVEELACDLQCRLQAYQEIGLPPNEAEEQAVKALGSPLKLARSLVFAHIPDFKPRFALPAMLFLGGITVFWPWAMWWSFGRGGNVGASDDWWMKCAWCMAAAFVLMAFLHGRFAWKQILIVVGAACTLNWILVSTLFLDLGQLDGYTIASPWEVQLVSRDMPGEMDWLRAKIAGGPLPGGVRLSFSPGLLSSKDDLTQQLDKDEDLTRDVDEAMKRPCYLQLKGFLPSMLQYFGIAFALTAGISGIASAARTAWRELRWRRRRFRA